MKIFKIFPFNEWKESRSYFYQKYFNDLKMKIEKFFENYDELDFGYFEYDSTMAIGQIETGFLYFSEKNISYKIEIIVDIEAVQEDVIESLDFVMFGYDKLTGKEIGSISTNVKEEEITEDLLIRLIDEFKEKYNEKIEEFNKPENNTNEFN
jgi:hypothetical protein